MTQDLTAQALDLGVKVDKRWSTNRLKAEINKASTGEPEKATPVVEDIIKDSAWAQKHLDAVWAGQSPSLSKIERIGRVRAALKGHGFTDYESLDWPIPDAARYL